VPTSIPLERVEWIARHERCNPQAAVHVAEQLEATVRSSAHGLMLKVCTCPDQFEVNSAGLYVQRLWKCLEYHWRQLGQNRRLPFAELIRRLKSGDLGYQAGGTNLLFEVVLAQALEMRQAKAADIFDRDYMPLVCGVAKRIAGQRGEDAVDNFGAELILPREGRPPRIATYEGKTTLSNWLRSVVTNFCLSHLRSRPAVSLTVDVCERGDRLRAPDSDLGPCEYLLRPLFITVARSLPAEDRLLITMLVLDEVPQKELARSLGINSGNVTRRRQRITARIWDGLRDLAASAEKVEEVTDCLNLVLAGENSEARLRLGQVLADRIRQPSAGEDAEP